MNARPSEIVTIRLALERAARRLSAAGITATRLEARLLLAEAAGIAPERQLADPDRPVGADQAARFSHLVERRAQREPMAHILGRREFWSLPFAVTADTLVPRPETETVVEAALGSIGDRTRPIRLLDLGTGSGCLLLALLSALPNAWGLGVDASPAAVRVARQNAALLGLAARAQFIVADWGAALGAAAFDLAVSNPPYVVDAEIDRLAPEVARFEPRLALAGGPDGLACYRALVPDLARSVRPGGVAVVELGQGQADDVARLAAAARLIETGRGLDLAGIARCLIMQRAPSPR